MSGDGELAALRRRVAELEAELAETQRRANAAVARAQARRLPRDRWALRVRGLRARLRGR